MAARRQPPPGAPPPACRPCSASPGDLVKWSWVCRDSGLLSLPALALPPCRQGLNNLGHWRGCPAPHFFTRSQQCDQPRPSMTLNALRHNYQLAKSLTAGRAFAVLKATPMGMAPVGVCRRRWRRMRMPIRGMPVLRGAGAARSPGIQQPIPVIGRLVFESTNCHLSWSTQCVGAVRANQIKKTITREAFFIC